jgi:hypothetical protein
MQLKAGSKGDVKIQLTYLQQLPQLAASGCYSGGLDRGMIGRHHSRFPYCMTSRSLKGAHAEQLSLGGIGATPLCNCS